MKFFFASNQTHASNYSPEQLHKSRNKGSGNVSGTTRIEMATDERSDSAIEYIKEKYGYKTVVKAVRYCLQEMAELESFSRSSNDDNQKTKLLSFSLENRFIKTIPIFSQPYKWGIFRLTKGYPDQRINFLPKNEDFKPEKHIPIILSSEMFNVFEAMREQSEFSSEERGRYLRMLVITFAGLNVISEYPNTALEWRELESTSDDYGGADKNVS